MPETKEIDVEVTNHGGLFLFRPLTQTGIDWITENLPNAQKFGKATAVEHRFARNVADGMQADGLKLE